MMVSSDTPQKPFFYAFDLDDVVPQDHLLRHIDRFLDLSDLRQHLAPYYSHTGCAIEEGIAQRSTHVSARDVAREVAKTPAYRRTRRQRKQVEKFFGHMKHILKVDRLRLRGLSGAQDEFLLTAIVQNLRRMAKYLGTGPLVASGIA